MHGYRPQESPIPQEHTRAYWAHEPNPAGLERTRAPLIWHFRTLEPIVWRYLLINTADVSELKLPDDLVHVHGRGETRRGR